MNLMNLIMLLVLKIDIEVSLADAKNDQAEFKSGLSEKKRKQKSIDQKSKIIHCIMLYKSRNSVIKFFEDYSSMVSRAKLKATKGTGLKILTPKKMFQRLPVALAQVKEGNNLLNEIRQIVYSLYQSK